MKKHLSALCLAITLSTLTLQAQHAGHHKDSALSKTKSTNEQMDIPPSLKKEHELLHQRLQSATQLQGKTGEAAKTLAKVLHLHFEKEEAYALPPLSLLANLAKGEKSANIEAVIKQTDQLKAEWAQMMKEHEQIGIALQKLAQAANEEKHPDVVEFTESLRLHAQTEEEVLYPAAILVGAYLKEKSAKKM